MDKLIDEQLVELYLKGEKLALEFLIRRYLAPVFNFVLVYVQDRAVADDVTQEVFVKVWKKLKKYDNHYKFKTWLFTIAKNTSLDYLKKTRAVTFSELSRLDDNLVFEEMVREGSASPMETLAIAADAEIVNRAIGQLSDKHKETVRLHYQEGYKFREIAKSLKESMETIKSRNRRALEQLRKLIKK